MCVHVVIVMACRKGGVSCVCVHVVIVMACRKGGVLCVCACGDCHVS